MVQQILVPFQGEGSGVGELSWAQLAIWRMTIKDGRSQTIGDLVPISPGVSVQDLVTILAHIVGRHEALRTRLHIQPDGRVLQEVYTRGEVPLEVVDVADGEDPAEVGEAVRTRYVANDFDYGNEWPVRMAAIRRRGVVTHVVTIYLHTAVDAQGIRVLVDELSLLDLKTGRSTAPPPGMSPR